MLALPRTHHSDVSLTKTAAGSVRYCIPHLDNFPVRSALLYRFTELVLNADKPVVTFTRSALQCLYCVHTVLRLGAPFKISKRIVYAYAVFVVALFANNACEGLQH